MVTVNGLALLALWAEMLGDSFTVISARRMEETACMWSPALLISTPIVVVGNRTISISDAHRTGPGKRAALFKCLLRPVA